MVTNRRELEGAIAARAMSSPSFRAALLADSRKAILSEFNVAVPDGVTFTVHEESPRDIHIVIPARAAAQLSEHQLDTVAGGMHISHVTGGSGSGGSSSPTTPSPSRPLPLPWPKWF